MLERFLGVAGAFGDEIEEPGEQRVAVELARGGQRRFGSRCRRGRFLGDRRGNRRMLAIGVRNRNLGGGRRCDPWSGLHGGEAVGRRQRCMGRAVRVGVAVERRLRKARGAARPEIAEHHALLRLQEPGHHVLESHHHLLAPVGKRMNGLMRSIGRWSVKGRLCVGGIHRHSGGFGIGLTRRLRPGRGG